MLPVSLLLYTMAGGSGIVAAIARVTLIRLAALTLIPILILVGWLGAAVVTAPNVVKYHYDGIPFSQLPDSGEIVVKFHNTSDKKIEIGGFKLQIAPANNNTNESVYSDILPYSTRKDNLIPNNQYIIGPHQTVSLIVPYRWQSYGKQRTEIGHGEIDNVIFWQEDGCVAGSGCDQNRVSLIKIDN